MVTNQRSRSADWEHPLPRLPEIIRTRREELDMSQAHLAALAKVSQSCICRWESGNRVPAGHHLLLLLRILRITYEEVAA